MATKCGSYAENLSKNHLIFFIHQAFTQKRKLKPGMGVPMMLGVLIGGIRKSLHIRWAISLGAADLERRISNFLCAVCY